MATTEKRYAIDCRESGKDCSLRISGTYEEVLATSVHHGRTVHGMTGDDKTLREELGKYVKEEFEAPFAPAGTKRPEAQPRLPS